MSSTRPFERLHPAVQYHIVNSLGWQDLRPLQERSIAPILGGSNLLCLAPTAGGKTEAAVFPLLSRMLASDAKGLGIIYVCPIKALLNNLFHRLSLYAGYLGRRVGLWHGDIPDSDKRRVLAEPPDILLTTPESIELLLISVRTEPRRLFSGLTAVVVDELHAFAGFDRGWQLLALVERLAAMAGRDVQRIGLSATVGNPEDLLRWLSGSSARPREAVQVSSAGLPAPEVRLDYVGGIQNAATVIARLHRGEKRLVFCDSRRQAEELTCALRAEGVSTFVSHSSLSRDARHQAEQAFAEGSNCVIVATSTLELGVDVGDLDRVIQIDAPFSVASFLQRLGRTGRRSGNPRNCLFLATTEAAFLRAGALIGLWRRGYVEPVTPPPFPVQVVAQQMLALVLQDGRATPADLLRRFTGVSPLADEIDESALREILAHLLAKGYLVEDQGSLSMGPAAEQAFGRRHYLALLSVFESQSTYSVRFGRTDIGQLQTIGLKSSLETWPYVTLGGRSWHVTHLDEARRLIYVEPSDVRGKSRWLGAGQTLGHAFCQAMRDFIVLDAVPDWLSARGRALFSELGEEFAWVRGDGTSLLQQEDGVAVWWNFAGYKANLLASKRLARTLDVARFSDCWLELRSRADLASLAKAIAEGLAGPDTDLLIEPEDGKFSVLLPARLATRQAMSRSLDSSGLDAVLQGAIHAVKDLPDGGTDG